MAVTMDAHTLTALLLNDICQGVNSLNSLRQGYHDAQIRSCLPSKDLFHGAMLVRSLAKPAILEY